MSEVAISKATEICIVLLIMSVISGTIAVLVLSFLYGTLHKEDKNRKSEYDFHHFV